MEDELFFREVGVPIEEVPLLNLLEIAIRTGNDHEKVKHILAATYFREKVINEFIFR